MRSTSVRCARKKLISIVVALIVLTGTQSAWALSGTLAESNVEVELNDTGMVDWKLDGIDHLKRQWFWVRVGDSGPEKLLDGNNFIETFSTFPSPAFGSFANYFDPGTRLDISVFDMVVGGIPGRQWSDIAQTVRLRNYGAGYLSVHLFQYVDLDLGGTAEGDIARWVTPNVISQHQQVGTGIAGGDHAVVDMSVMGVPSKVMLGSPDELLGMLNDDYATNLTTVPYAGGDDVAWLLQWDIKLDPNGMAILSEDMLMYPAPEPVTMLSVVMGVFGIGRYARRRRRKASA